MNPIIVIIDKMAYEFDNITEAQLVASWFGGVVVVPIHWYQAKCEQVEMLIGGSGG